MGSIGTVETSHPELDGGPNSTATRPKTFDATESADVKSAAATTTTSEWSVETVLDNLPETSSINPALSPPVPFLHLLERLKTTKREGWRRFGISSGESIADHMYRMSIITLLCPPSLASRLDVSRCTKMALVHDMAESLVGDITPVDGVAKPEKARRERATMQYLGSGLLGPYSGGKPGEEIMHLWEEYEAGETQEAIFVHDVDKMELLLQMVEYERRGEGQLDLGEFAWVAKKIQLEEMKVWCQELLREREGLWRKYDKRPTNVDLMDR